jgi:type II secretory pathway component PulM
MTVKAFIQSRVRWLRRRIRRWHDQLTPRTRRCILLGMFLLLVGLYGLLLFGPAPRFDFGRMELPSLENLKIR